MLNSSRQICSTFKNSKLVFSSSVRYLNLGSTNQNSWLAKALANPTHVKRSLGSISFGSSLVDERKRFNENSNKSNSAKIFLFFCGVFGVSVYKINSELSYSKEKDEEAEEKEASCGKIVEGLPYYTEEEVLKHTKGSGSIWVSYKNGVYDITEFVESHPGGNKIMLGAGTSLEPFWDLYAVHKKADVYEILEAYRIGNLKVDTTRKVTQGADPFINEPKRHGLLKAITKKPFNAETPSEFSVDSLLTPKQLHFVRNHFPVPIVDIEKFELEISNDLNGKIKKFKLDEFKKSFKTYTIPVTIQCSGNKRKYMHEYEPVQGLMWSANAISTAEWTGVRLKDLLTYCGVDLTDERIKHIHFEGLDKDPVGAPYAASIPKEKVLNDFGDVLIAFQMNGQDIPADHGFPLRAVVPGVVGARSVKWLNKIVVSVIESPSHWQQNDYKLLSPSIKNLKNADFSKFRAVQESPVQSAICEPVNGAQIRKTKTNFRCKGYAFSGAGRSIESVLVSTDDGKTWKNAKIKQFDSPLYRSWAWAIWEVELDVPKDKESLEVVCMAVDSDQNTQPETVKAIWNARGIMNNSWHRIKVEFK